MTLKEKPTFWINKQSLKDFQPLQENMEVDVCIIGGGIAGLTSAYQLIQSGKSVAVLEDGSIASGQTSRTSAHLSTLLDSRYQDLEKLFGLEGAKLAAQSHGKAIDFIEETVIKHKIDCGFARVNAYLFVHPGDSTDVLYAEVDAAQRAGLTDTTIIERAPFSSFDSGPSVQCPHQAQFFPLKYIEALTNLILKQNGKIFTQTHAAEIEEKDGVCIVRTSDGFQVKSDSIIVATNSPVNNRFFPHLKQAAYRTYLIGGKIPKDSVQQALYYDTLDPYHYIRVIPDVAHDYLLVGGEDHRVGECKDPEKLYDLIEDWTKDRFPEFTQRDFQWSGQVVEPIDGLAFIGLSSNTSRVYIATGTSGNGLTYGTIAGLLLTDLILKNPNPWKDLYDPHRKNLGAAKEFFQENINTAIQYGDWLTPGDVDSIKKIPKNSGAIVREGLKKIAVYRDSEGKIHKFSAVCPHLQGLLRWNSESSTWDCPCHGSRFAVDGTVLSGPANSNLKEE